MKCMYGRIWVYVYDVGPNDGAKHYLKHIKQILTDDIHTYIYADVCGLDGGEILERDKNLVYIK